MQFTYSDDIVSDLHKDARGYRPTEYFWEEWTQSPPESKQLVWDILCEELEIRNADDAAAEARSLNKFRESVRNTMNYCNCKWNKAVEFLCVADGDNINCDQSFDYFLWKQGIGFNDRKKIFNLYKETTV